MVTYTVKCRNLAHRRAVMKMLGSLGCRMGSGQTPEDFANALPGNLVIHLLGKKILLGSVTEAGSRELDLSSLPDWLMMTAIVVDEKEVIVGDNGVAVGCQTICPHDVNQLVARITAQPWYRCVEIQ